MRVLLLGASGLLGHELRPALEAQGHELRCPSAQAFDLLRPEGWGPWLEGVDAVANLAAATAVDRCEQEPGWAYALNAAGPEALARACGRAELPLMQLSTDYVFGGGGQAGPHGVGDRPWPTNTYGRSKLAGELAVRALAPRHFIVRTAWLFGGGGRPNFVDTMARLGAQGTPLRVVHDQRGNPTWTRPLAAALAALLEGEAYGLHHFAGSGEASWAELAEATLAGLGLPTPVERVGSEAFPRPAPRAKDSRLAPGPWPPGVPALPPWREALAAHLAERRSAANPGASPQP